MTSNNYYLHPSDRRDVDAKDAIRRVLDGETRVEVTDSRGRVVVAYYRKTDGVIYVCDRQGERPVIFLDKKKRKRKPRN
jgi:hypothetical protein